MSSGGKLKKEIIKRERVIVYWVTKKPSLSLLPQFKLLRCKKYTSCYVVQTCLIKYMIGSLVINLCLLSALLRALRGTGHGIPDRGGGILGGLHC